MVTGTFEETLYIVHYRDQGRSEGGPIVTRHFQTEKSAKKFISQLDIDMQVTAILTRQYSIIKRERINIAS